MKRLIGVCTSSAANRLIVMAVAIAAWIAIDANSVVGQDNSSSAPVVLEQAESSGWTSHFFDSLASLTIPEVTFAAIVLIASLTIGYSVLTKGKQGWGWITLSVFAGILAIAIRIGGSLFQEMSVANEISDWDTD